MGPFSNTTRRDERDDICFQGRKLTIRLRVAHERLVDLPRWQVRTIKSSPWTIFRPTPWTRQEGPCWSDYLFTHSTSSRSRYCGNCFSIYFFRSLPVLLLFTEPQISSSPSLSKVKAPRCALEIEEMFLSSQSSHLRKLVEKKLSPLSFLESFANKKDTLWSCRLFFFPELWQWTRYWLYGIKIKYWNSSLTVKLISLSTEAITWTS